MGYTGHYNTLSQRFQLDFFRVVHYNDSCALKPRAAPLLAATAAR